MSDITYTLPNFPQINQLHEATADGQPDENASWNCVPASIADGLIYLTGKAFDGDELKDAVYGQGYTGAQAPAEYVAYCARQGVDLVPVHGMPGQLVARIHSEIAAGHPVVGTIPSQWGTPVAQQPVGFTTHVVVFCGEGPGALRADNPWIAPAWHDGDDAYWTDRLCYGQVWVMQTRKEEVAAVAWTQHDGHGGAIDSQGHTVGAGLAGALIGNKAPDGKRSETPFDAAGDVFVDLTDGQVYTWTKAEGARTDRGGLVIEALLGEIATLQARAAQPAPAPVPADPRGAAALQLLQAIVALGGQK